MNAKASKLVKMLYLIAVLVCMATLLSFVVGFTVTTIEVAQIPDTPGNQSARGMTAIGYATTYLSSGLIGFPAALYVLWFARKYVTKDITKRLNYAMVGAVVVMIIGPIVYMLFDGLAYVLYEDSSP